MHVRSSAGLFGAENVILNLVSTASVTDTEQYLCCLDHGSLASGALVRKAEKKGIKTKTVPCKGRFDPRLVFRLVKCAREAKIDILHCHEYKSNFYGLIAGKLTGIQTISTVHGWIGTTRALRFYKAIDLHILRLMDQVIAVSKPIEKELLNAGVRGERLVAIDNGIDTDRFAPGHARILRRQLGIDEDAVVIGTVGRLSKEKAHSALLEAISKCRNSIGRTRIVCIGDGPLREDLREMCNRLGLNATVTFVGHIEDPVPYYQLFDIFVLPSLTEGMPLALLEAMACGKPVIASSVGSIPEVLSCGEAGRLVPAGDVDGLAAALEDLVNNADKRKVMAEKAREVALARYSLKAQLEKYVAVYRQIAFR